MSTEDNTPTPGTAAWLRMAADHWEPTALLLAAGLRAAAERIEQLMRKIAQQEDWWQEMQRLRAENEVLRKAITAWAQATRLRCLHCDEDHDAAPCSCVDDLAALERAENALRELAADPARKEGAS